MAVEPHSRYPSPWMLRRAGSPVTTAVAGASEGTASCSVFLPWVFSPCFEHLPFPSWVCGQQRQQHQQQQGAPELAASASTGCSRRLTSSTKSVSAPREFRASVFGLVGFAVTLCRSSLPLLKRGTGLQGTGRFKDPAGAGAAVFGAVAKGLSSALERARGKRAQSLGPPGESVDAEEGGEEEVRRRYVRPRHLPEQQPPALSCLHPLTRSASSTASDPLSVVQHTSVLHGCPEPCVYPTTTTRVPSS